MNNNNSIKNTTVPGQISQIGKNLKKIKKEKGLSEDLLSKLVDISYNTAIRPESGGINNFTTETLQKLAKALNIYINNLIINIYINNLINSGDKQ